MSETTQKTTHTPTPWSRDPIVYQSGCERTIYIKSEVTGRTVGILSCITPNDYPNDFKGDREREVELVATAEFILRAANGHDELLAALRRIQAMAAEDIRQERTFVCHSYMHQIEADARAAVAKVEGKQ